MTWGPSGGLQTWVRTSDCATGELIVDLVCFIKLPTAVSFSDFIGLLETQVVELL